MTSPISLHKYLYAVGDPVGLVDPSGLSGVPGHVYQALGMAVDWMFKGYVRALGYDRPGATLATLLPEHFATSPEGALKPDLTDVKGHAYYELKPVTWAQDRIIPQTGQRTLTDLLRPQMASYDNALQPIGFDRGNSPGLTFNQAKMPLGLLPYLGKTYLVSLRPAEPILVNGDDGRGVLWYELDETDGEKWRNRQRMVLPDALGVPQQWKDTIDLFHFDEQDNPINLYWVVTGVVASTLGWATWLAINASQASAACATASISVAFVSASLTSRYAA